MFLKIFLLITCLVYCAESNVIDICQEFCTTERSLDLQYGDVQFVACDGDLIKLEFLPDKKTDGWIILLDTETDRKLFYKKGFESSDDDQVISSTNKVTLAHSLSDDEFSSFDIRYSCQPKETFSETVHYGAGNRTILVDANQVITYNLTSNDDNLLVDVGLDFPSPLAGFTTVNIGDGRYAIGFKQLSLSLDNMAREEVSRDVNIITSNTPMFGAGLAEVSYDLGEEDNSKTSTSPTSTTTTPSQDKIVTVFLVSVMEYNFVNKSLENFKTKTWKIMQDVCPSLNESSDNYIHYSPAYSCRQLCSMSTRTERGCVMIEMHLENIPASTYCTYTEDISRVEYFRSKLREMSKEFRKEFSAGRMSVDTCNDIGWTTQWVWVSVGLVVAVVLLSLLIMFTKRRLRRGGARQLDDYEKEDETEKYNYKAKIRYNNAFEFEE